jgi:hypothetical protein
MHAIAVRGYCSAILSARQFGVWCGCSGVLIHTGGPMKSLMAKVVGSVSMLASGVSSAQSGGMMNGGMGGAGWMGGYGGYWVPVLLVVVVGLVALIVMKSRK